MMKITEDKHTLSFNVGSGEGALMMVSHELLSNAPEFFRDVINRLGSACAFLEQFGLSGHFVTRKDECGKPAVSCILVLPLELNVREIIEDNKIKPGNEHVTALAPSLSFCLYAGLRHILAFKEQLNQASSTMYVTDASEAIKWDGHTVLSVCYTKSEHDVTSGVFVFMEDPECYMRLIGSYSSMEDKLISEEGVDLDAPKTVKERFRNIFGAELLEQQIRDVIGNKEGN